MRAPAPFRASQRRPPNPLSRGGGPLVALTALLLATCIKEPTGPPATYITFRTQPSHSTAGVMMAPVAVAARDADGKIATSFRGEVTLAIATNPAGGTLTGTTTVTAVDGVATFDDLSIDHAGTGYRLTATAGEFAPITSSRFDILGGTAVGLDFTVDPSTVRAGNVFSPVVQVSAVDALGNRADGFAGAITVTITSGTGTDGAGLLGTTTVTASAGIATFTTLGVNLVGTGYTLTATATGLTATTSDHFDVLPGSATQLVFTVHPTNVTAGEPIAPAVVVVARDAQGNHATEYTGNVTMELTAGIGPPDANLFGTRTVAAVGGVATFSALSVNRSGTGYTLSVRASGPTGAVSGQFDVAPAAVTQLAFSAQPQTSTAGAVLPPALVAARDSLGNTVTSFTEAVTLTIGVNPGGGSLAGTTTVVAAQGVATFSDLSIDKTGTGYRLVATAGAFTRQSNAFSITAAGATHLAFTEEPATTPAGAGMTPSVRIAALDPQGNVATSFAGAITVAIGNNPVNGVLSGVTTVTATSGVATFPGLSIDKVGSGYTLTATTSGLTGTTSAAFDIIASTATQLAFTVQPSSAVAGVAITPAVVVIARDAQGNTATDFTGNITVEITAGTGTAGANLRGTRTVAAVAGVATFSTLNVNRSGTGYTLSARSSGLTGAVSTAFDIVPAPVVQLAFTAQPQTSVAGVALPPIVVTAQDSLANTVTSFTSNVTLTIDVNPGPGTLSGTTTVAAVAGIATFSTLSIDRAATGYRLRAAADAFTRQSNAFSITPGPATKLGFTVQPTTSPANGDISPSVRVAAQDAFGNTATGFVSNITIAIATNPAGGVLSGTVTVGAVAGVAIFDDLSIDKAGSGYTLRATSSGLTQTTSAAFDITSSSATQLAFTAQPTTEVAGATITPAIQVTARDGAGNTATDYIGNVTLVITGGTGTAGATLSGARTVAAVAGVATFSTLSIDRSGTGYTLTASASGLTGAVSAPFNITPGSATVLAFTVHPTTSVAGAAIAPPVQVTARDALGNTVTGFTGNVTVAITPGTGPASAVLSGTKTVAAVAGVASFSTLSIDTVNTGYRLTATATSLTPDTSNAFSITPGTATRLAFTVQPTTTNAGGNISPSVRVAAQDALGNTATSFVGNITLAITSGTGAAGAILSGPNPVAASSGVAIFSGMSIDKAGTNYTLRATATGLTQATSAAFDITSSSATQLAFTAQPTTEVAGAPITPAIQVTARDGNGNVATEYIGNVTVVITGGTGTAGATLSGTRTVAAVGGVATFSTLSIDKAGTGYTLTATASGLTGAVSAPFNITPGSATVLAFTVHPTTSVAGTAIAPPVQVTARDALGNAVTGFTGSVTVAITPGTGPASAVLSGTKTVAAVAGVASFGNLSIDTVNTGYRLTATSGALTPDTSSAFSITPGAATRLAFTVQPTTSTAGGNISPAVRVAAQDALGNTATSFNANITLAITSGTGTAGAVLSGPNPVTASSGVAIFSGMSIDKAGTNYTLRATATGLTQATSAAFDITASSATQLVVTAQPTTEVAGAPITPAIQVTAQDANGNTATGYINNVSVTITGGTGTAGANLSGTKTVAAIAGVATFSDLSIDKAGIGYTLTFTASGVSDVVSGSFNITSGAAAVLVFTVHPTTGPAGAVIAPPVQVTARDALGNTVTNFAADVTVAITPGTGAAGAVLSGTATVAAVAGIASFGNLSINLAAVGYRLDATSGVLPTVTSNAFTMQ